MNQWYAANLILIQGTLANFLLALSIQMPLRMGVFSFAGIGAYGIGAYSSVIITLDHDWPPLLSIALGMAIAALAGFVLSLFVQRLDGVYLGMATIAFVLILSVVAGNGGDFTGGATGLFGAVVDLPIWQVLVIVGLAILAVALSERGRVGRRIEALREDPELALSMGINVIRMRRLSFVLSGLLGGSAGAISALLRSTASQDDLSFSLVVLALTMIIVGGAHSWLGAAIGALIFTWLPTALSFVGQWHEIIYGIIVALAAIWVPGGAIGLATRWFRAVQIRRRPTQQAIADSTIPSASDHDVGALQGLVEETPTGQRA